jgi:hypothetical protein
LPRDKVYHFIAGGIASIFGCALFNPFAGFFFATCAGCGKELFDYYDYGVFDYQDLFATMGGGLLISGAYYGLF